MIDGTFRKINGVLVFVSRPGPKIVRWEAEVNREWKEINRRLQYGGLPAGGWKS